jgi:hypothetical protein
MVTIELKSGELYRGYLTEAEVYILFIHFRSDQSISFF